MDKHVEDNDLKILDFAILFYINFKSRTSGAVYENLREFYLKCENNNGEQQLITKLQNFIRKKWVTAIHARNEASSFENSLLFVQKGGKKKYEEVYELLFPTLKTIVDI